MAPEFCYNLMCASNALIVTRTVLVRKPDTNSIYAQLHLCPE